jgi:hypothetical protein
VAATKLGLYNGALRVLRERKLASLTENREPRRLLDDAWGDGSTNGVVRYCLEMGQWTFATRTVEIDYSPSVTPSFGYDYAFDQPTDLVRTIGVFCDEDCSTPLLQYADERRYWYAYLQTMYVKYVSNHASYGADLSLWPENFSKIVEARLALEIAGNLTQGTDKVTLADRHWKEAKKEARSFDAMNKPTAFFPEGAWSQSRRGRSRRNDGQGYY